ncbi:hypothetical protein [Arthrobacter sp. D2-10]
MQPSNTKPVTEFGRRRNLWRNTEDIQGAQYSVGSGFTRTTETVSIDGVVLTKINVNSFYSNMYSNFGGVALGMFVAGRRYLLSYYITTGGATERFFWMRNMPDTGRGHGQRLIQPGKLTRAWQIVQAINADQVAPVMDPAVGFHTSSAGYWFFEGH